MTAKGQKIGNDTNRVGDSDGARFFRSSSRIFNMNGEWWFGAREGDQGPYGSEELAELELERYITSCQLLDTKLAYKKIPPKTKKPELVLLDFENPAREPFIR